MTLQLIALGPPHHSNLLPVQSILQALELVVAPVEAEPP